MLSDRKAARSVFLWRDKSPEDRSDVRPIDDSNFLSHSFIFQMLDVDPDAGLNFRNRRIL
jgi:hypothetical protein